jgi:hypothetical protein
MIKHCIGKKSLKLPKLKVRKGGLPPLLVFSEKWQMRNGNFSIREFNLEVQRSTNLPLPLGEGRGEGL